MGDASIGSAAFWDERYSSVRTPMEWLLDLEQAEAACGFLRLVPPGAVVLVLGCGSSAFGADLQRRARCTVLDTDVSRVAVHQLGAATERAVMDATALPVRSGSVDVVVDKSTLDALVCGHACAAAPGALAREARRVLRPGGVMLLWSLNEWATLCSHAQWGGFSCSVSRFANPGEDADLMPELTYAVLRPVSSGDGSGDEVEWGEFAEAESTSSVVN